MQAQLRVCFVLGKALPRRAERRGCSDTRAALPGFSAAFYPALCTEQDGGRAAPSLSWLGRAGGWVMELMDAFSSLAL